MILLLAVIAAPIVTCGVLCFLDIFGRCANDQQVAGDDWQDFDAFQCGFTTFTRLDLIGTVPRFHLVGWGETEDAALKLARSLRPDLFAKPEERTVAA